MDIEESRTMREGEEGKERKSEGMDMKGKWRRGKEEKYGYEGFNRER